MAMLQIEKLLG